ncbi:hypothetical protein SAMN05421663_102157 [Terribacillus halophilus]|uniref:Uncharacterized protein n=1 Tax=Terribacillus halophilus TaxID=361279 RepID=A0A1G6KVC8_9BACI|nr:hypothetical protein [Terribacillus halophilus]SDC35040.1 hypothetical protein SAMN05421663_102157 [Terribacillus halophilus]
MKSFDDYCRDLGLSRYPFALYTTENELGLENELFIRPNMYSPIIESFTNRLSMILVGNRGTGKTAILYDFKRTLDDKYDFVCTIDDYDKLEKKFSSGEFYTFLLSKLSIQLFTALAEDKRKARKKLSQEDKVLLSYLLANFVPQVSKRVIKTRIENIQVNKFKKESIKFFNLFRNMFNWGASAGAVIIDDYIMKRVSGMPPINSEGVFKEYFPELPVEIDADFADIEVTYQLLLDVLKLINKIGYKKTVVLLDKIDEDSRLNNNGESIAEFVEPIVTDNKLLLNENIQIVISMWIIPYNFLLENIRTQKHYVPVLQWSKEDLKKALNKRLLIFSEEKIKDYKDIFDDQYSEELDEEIFTLANNNPRDLWHIFDKILKENYESNSEAVKLQARVIKKALEKFVSSFNYYEYYPRKKNAYKNSMDFYSYTAYLLKLDSPTFTKNQLNIKAGTGGSTNNYVVGMERIGLIEKTDQVSGALYFTIKDPKVRYALKEGIKIEKVS